MGIEHASEQGFIQQLPDAERARGRQALESAILQNLLSDEEQLRFLKFVEQHGKPKKALLHKGKPTPQ